MGRTGKNPHYQYCRPKLITLSGDRWIMPVKQFEPFFQADKGHDMASAAQCFLFLGKKNCQEINYLVSVIYIILGVRFFLIADEDSKT
jgi:hypothetical protein